ncbi:MAG: DUF1576 domain-containing protein, partial [Erysipelotrichaceae bacterium]|nr:DUF1576 domain-containing protein [Erysipelotrichaceae bacterium]
MDKNKKLVLVFGLYSCLLMVFGLIGNDLSTSINGIKTIITSPAQLTIDYFLIGSVGGTFLNAGLVGLSCTLLFYLSKADLNGLSIMSFILTIG